MRQLRRFISKGLLQLLARRGLPCLVQGTLMLVRGQLTLGCAHTVLNVHAALQFLLLLYVNAADVPRQRDVSYCRMKVWHMR